MQRLIKSEEKAISYYQRTWIVLKEATLNGWNSTPHRGEADNNYAAELQSASIQKGSLATRYFIFSVQFTYVTKSTSYWC